MNGLKPGTSSRQAERRPENAVQDSSLENKNMASRTVFLQRFRENSGTLQGGQVMKHRYFVSFATLSAFSLIALALAQSRAIQGTIVARGLNGPQGVLVAKDGSVYVTDTGVGGPTKLNTINPDTGKPAVAGIGNTARVYRINNGRKSVVASIPLMVISGPDGGGTGGSRLAILGDQLYVSSGSWEQAQGPRPFPKMAAVLRVSRDGSTQTVTDLWKLERTQNPGGFGVTQSHPYGMAVT